MPRLPFAGDLGAIFEAGNRVFREAAMTGARVWGRLAQLVEKAEQQHGLWPLEFLQQQAKAA